MEHALCRPKLLPCSLWTESVSGPWPCFTWTDLLRRTDSELRKYLFNLRRTLELEFVWSAGSCPFRPTSIDFDPFHYLSYLFLSMICLSFIDMPTRRKESSREEGSLLPKSFRDCACSVDWKWWWTKIDQFHFSREKSLQVVFWPHFEIKKKVEAGKPYATWFHSRREGQRVSKELAHFQQLEKCLLFSLNVQKGKAHRMRIEAGPKEEK